MLGQFKKLRSIENIVRFLNSFGRRGKASDGPGAGAAGTVTWCRRTTSFQFQRNAATNAKREKGNNRRKNRFHADEGGAVTQQSLGYLTIPEF